MSTRSLLRFIAIVGLGLCLTAANADPKKSTAEAKPPVAKKMRPPVEVAAALTTLDNLLTAYMQGESTKFEGYTDPSMIGRGALSDAMRQSHLNQKQIRVTLTDKTYSAGQNIVVIQTNWLKHSLVFRGLSASKRSGKSTFFMTKGGDGWQLSGMTGDNVFAP